MKERLLIPLFHRFGRIGSIFPIKKKETQTVNFSLNLQQN
jgi:hypothetical protein